MRPYHQFSTTVDLPEKIDNYLLESIGDELEALFTDSMEQFYHECHLLMDSKWKAFMEVMLRKLNILRSFSSKIAQNNEYLNMKTSLLSRDKEQFES